MSHRAKAIEAELIEFASSLPEAWIDHPWDHTVVKVGQKVFVFFGGAAGPPGALSMTVKLPVSAEMALTLPNVAPAGHGLGKAGWVQLVEADAARIDTPTCRGWIIQSFRAVAPKKLAARLDGALPD